MKKVPWFPEMEISNKDNLRWWKGNWRWWWWHKFYPNYDKKNAEGPQKKNLMLLLILLWVFRMWTRRIVRTYPNLGMNFAEYTKWIWWNRSSWCKKNIFFSLISAYSWSSWSRSWRGKKFLSWIWSFIYALRMGRKILCKRDYWCGIIFCFSIANFTSTQDSFSVATRFLLLSKNNFVFFPTNWTKIGKMNEEGTLIPTNGNFQ